MCKTFGILFHAGLPDVGVADVLTG